MYKTIDIENWDRREIYEFYSGKRLPHYVVAANVDVTKLLEEFNEYPEMVDYINKLNKKDVKDDPFVVLKKFDEVIEKSKSSAT